MSNFLLFTDSSADLPYTYIDEHDIHSVNLSYVYGGKEYIDDFGKTDGYKSLYDNLRSGGTSTTSQINVNSFVDKLSPHLEAGSDILYLAFSSNLSGTCGSAMVAKDILTEKYPDARLIVVDTLSASMGQGMLVHYAREMRDQGKSLEETAAWVEDNKLKMNHWFTVATLEHLKRGGRVSGASALIASVLEIKPIMCVDDNGKLIARSKTIGRKKSLKGIVERLAEKIIDPSNQVIGISHGDCLDDATKVKAMIESKITPLGFIINNVGPVIGSHSGPGTMAIFFLGKPREGEN